MSIILHNILPVFAVIALGHVLGRTGFAPGEFYRVSDRMVYYVFFPALLFWKIGGAGDTAGSGALIAATLGPVLIGHLVSLAYIAAARVPRFQAGSFSQLSFRFNTYVGLAVVLSAFGEKGVADFGLVITAAIPVINVLAVTTLIWFSKGRYSPGEKAGLIAKAMIANPLIVACLAGLAYSALNTPFPPFFDNTFRLLSVAALPLALLSIGQALTLEGLWENLGPSLIASSIKLVLLPAAGYGILTLLGVDGLRFQVAMVYLALPTAATAYILSSQLGSDTKLASAGIVLSTFLSFFSLSVILLIIK